MQKRLSNRGQEIAAKLGKAGLANHKMPEDRAYFVEALRRRIMAVGLLFRRLCMPRVAVALKLSAPDRDREVISRFKGMEMQMPASTTLHFFRTWTPLDLEARPLK
jgi:hypothetical protein